MAVGMIGRIYWAFVGNVHARQMFVLPFWSAKFWREVLIEAQWYAFLRDYPKKYVGHNPLAQLAMVTIYSVGQHLHDHHRTWRSIRRARAREAGTTRRSAG